MRAFRIADRRFPLFDGTGARLAGGRWNSPGRSVIYAAETYAGAVLEVLVHANLGRLPRTHAWIEITIPSEVSTETVTAEIVPRWDAHDPSATRGFGDRWLEERRSAVLLVPSFVTRGRERNLLINPEHRQFSTIKTTKPQDVAWDERLFQQRTR
jgi:RES domain-containing protein